MSLGDGVKRFMEGCEGCTLGLLVVKSEGTKGEMLFPDGNKVRVYHLSMASYEKIDYDNFNIAAHLVRPAMEEEEVEWDGTPENLAEIADSYKDSMVMILCPQDEVPFQAKAFSGMMSYISMYRSRKFGH